MCLSQNSLVKVLSLIKLEYAWIDSSIKQALNIKYYLKRLNKSININMITIKCFTGLFK